MSVTLTCPSLFTRVPVPLMAVRLFSSFFFLKSCHNSLKTDCRDSVTILFVDLCRIYCHGSEKQGITKCRALTCTASPCRESRMMCRVQLWFGCTLTRWWGFYVVQTPALSLYHYNVRASGRTDVGEKLSKGIFSKIELDICPKWHYFYTNKHNFYFKDCLYS